MLLVCIKYSMCDLIYDVISRCLKLRHGKAMYMTKSWFITRKKENMEIKNIFT